METHATQHQPKKINKKLAIAAAIAGVVISSLILQGSNNRTSLPQNLTGNITTQIKNTVDSFGSTHQAAALLSSIDKSPGNKTYTISYTTGTTAATLSVDFKTGQIIRTNHYHNGENKIEGWTGEIMFRLNSAASGGSMNDTSKGKSFAKERTF